MTKDLFNACTPRGDVLAGDLAESIFAASLDEVVRGTAPVAYGDAEQFFAATFPSAGLRELLLEALGRVTGARPTAPPVIRLETNLGGGKTHNLIALWHAAKGGLPGLHKVNFVSDTSVVPDESVDAVAVFVGTSAGATDFPEVAGVRAESLWEHLALQLGGIEAADLVRGPTAPGDDRIKEIIGDRPTLILIDELARYLVGAAGVGVGESNLARQTVSFLMALMAAVDSSSNASLVITTTEVTDAFGDHTQAILDALKETGELIARKEHVLRPSAEADLPRILARRLFERIDDAAGAEVGKAYAAHAEQAFSRGADLPPDLQAGTWGDAVSDTYPFHPRLVEILDKRLSTIPNFQRTRGALRLLATVVRHLWDDPAAGTLLVHPHHVDVAVPTLAEELSSRLGRPKFENVIRADVTSGNPGSPAHAEEVDARMGTPFGGRLARTIYLNSLTEGVSGVSAPEALAAVLAPGDDHNVCSKALDALERSCWYLHVDDRGFRFSTEASLVKLVLDAQSRIPLGKVREAATDILGKQFRDAALKVRRSWEDARVPDREDEATLVLVHWDEFGDARGVDPRGNAPERVLDTWTNTPSGGLRQFRNRLVFLVPSLGTHDAMVDSVRRHLALKALAADTDRMAELSADRRTELKNLASESEMLARIAVCNHVNVLFVPSGDGLEAVELSTVTQASVRANQTDAVLDRLASMDKTLASGDPPVDPGLVKSRLGALLDQPLPTADLARAFARRGDMKLVLDKAQLLTVVRTGITNGVWEYHDTETDTWATTDRPAASVRLGEDTLLHPPGSAPAPEPVACPFCDNVHAAGECAGAGGGTNPPGGGGPTEPRLASVFRGSGSAASAVVVAAQAAADAGVEAVAAVEIAVDEVGAGLNQELARLHSLVPSGQPGAEVKHGVRAEFGDGSLLGSVDFSGPAAEFAPLKTACDHLLKKGDGTLKATTTASFDPPLRFDDQRWADLVQRATDTGPSRCTVVVQRASTQ